MIMCNFNVGILWYSGQSSWLQNQRTGFDSDLGLERGPLGLVTTIEELLERKSSGSCLETRDYGSRDPLRLPHYAHYPHILALTSPTSGGRYSSIAN
jgi:hypothetical protein